MSTITAKYKTHSPRLNWYFGIGYDEDLGRDPNIYYQDRILSVLADGKVYDVGAFYVPRADGQYEPEDEEQGHSWPCCDDIVESDKYSVADAADWNETEVIVLLPYDQSEITPEDVVEAVAKKIGCPKAIVTILEEPEEEPEQ